MKRILAGIILVQLGFVLWLVSAPSPILAPEVGSNEPIKPLPLTINIDPRKVTLGKALFHERKLSRDNSISCASCHDLGNGGADGLKYPVGINQAKGFINTPTVFNSGFNFKQFWDGRAATLEDQIDGPVQHPAEMGSTWEEVTQKLRAVEEYRALFQKVYTDGIQAGNIKDAIAHYERSLITPNSRFDKYLRGDQSVLTAEEKEGYRKFKRYGCVSCHQGVNIGGNMFETLGAMSDYFGGRTNVTTSDYGRFNVTGKEEDRYAFKVPGLRNVALTAPYFHDGSAKTLEQAVVAMGKFQLGRPLATNEVNEIAAFLRTLTGEYQGKPL